jgi:hypothetical protein
MEHTAGQEPNRGSHTTVQRIATIFGERSRMRGSFRGTDMILRKDHTRSSIVQRASEVIGSNLSVFTMEVTEAQTLRPE